MYIYMNTCNLQACTCIIHVCTCIHVAQASSQPCNQIEVDYMSFQPVVPLTLGILQTFQELHHLSSFPKFLQILFSQVLKTPKPNRNTPKRTHL